MKRVLCFIMMLLSLGSLLSFAVSASQKVEPLVMQELEDLVIDGRPFNEADYVVDKDKDEFEVLTVVESGFRTTSSSPDFALYIYVFNKACIDVQNNDVNSVQLGIGDDCKQFSMFGIQLVSKTEDNRFLKFKVINSLTYGFASICYSAQPDNSYRVYNVVNIRIFNGERLKSYPVDMAYTFTGYDLKDNYTLSCHTIQLGALQVELIDTNWISPNAGFRMDGTPASIYDHYEINSVYFRVPKEYWEKYEYLRSARAIFDALHLTPILMTCPEDIDDVTKNAIINGEKIELGSDKDIMDLVWDNMGVANGQNYKVGWNVYSESDSLWNASQSANLGGASIPMNSVHYDTLAYYFECLPTDFDYDEGKVTKAVLLDEELQAYFYERYNNPLYNNNKLYSEKITQTIELYSRNADDNALYKMQSVNDALANKSAWEKWIYKFGKEKDSYLFDEFSKQANHIDVFKSWDYIYDEFNLSSLSTNSEIADALHIGVADVARFKENMNAAIENEEYIVIMRFACTDYQMQVVRDAWELTPNVGPAVGVVVDKWAFMNVNVMDLTFYNDGVNIVVPVSSDTVDSFGDSDAAGDLNKEPEDYVKDVLDIDDNFWGRIKEALKWVLVCFVILLFLPVIIWLIKFVIKRVRKTVRAINSHRFKEPPNKRE